MAKSRPDPIIFEPKVAPDSPEQASAVIFLHGLNDDGESFRDLVNQYQNADKLPHTLWVLPTAAERSDAMMRAWYRPPKLTPRPPPRPELEDEADYEGIMETCRYVIAIVQDLNGRGIPTHRIAVGGFSQGCAVALVLGLASAYAGRFAGVFGLMGYLPLAARLDSVREDLAPGASVVEQPVLITRGTRDMLLPARYFQACSDVLDRLQIRKVDRHEYDIGHEVHGEGLADLCTFLQERCGF
ncbi:acyl-thioesterase 1 [Cordyceps militaris]|uniref:Acyl-protein thioesterase 1 n=1 Tax=Cordyceps militaris TaxID=73501 RepID=A0A2H4SJW2_CORMI|nr:acyl-thioesterase 1 [Cordyceps militaris]